MNPVQEGFALEDLIYKASLNLPNLTHSKRENEIKTHFTDNSLNGVDHWIQVGNTHIFIQDKWKESMGQQEVSQFINCVNRIKTRFVNTSLPNYMNIRLMWVSKYEPTSNAMKCLKEESVKMITCDTTIEELARKAIFEICEHFKVNPSVCLDVIPMKGGRDNQLLDNIDQIKLEEEARELLQIKKELIEKKKKEEEEKVLQRKLALDNIDKINYLVLQSYTGFRTNILEFKNWLKDKPTEEIQKIVNDIQSCYDIINSNIKQIIDEFMESVWKEQLETIIKSLKENHDSIYNGFISNIHKGPETYIANKLKGEEDTKLWFSYWEPCFSSPPPVPRCWKYYIIHELTPPIFGPKLNEFLLFCNKYVEYSKTPSFNPEGKQKIKSLEDEIASLKARNEVLQKKLDTIRSAL
jgi:hypothetical protein